MTVDFFVKYCYAEVTYAESCYPIMLFMLSVIMLNVVMLDVIMLNVVVPYYHLGSDIFYMELEIFVVRTINLEKCEETIISNIFKKLYLHW
jgi:hypothetical protein